MIFHYRTTPIYYTLKGNGPAMVFLHGFLEHSGMWDAILPEFKANHTLLTVDFPGHGQSGNVAAVHNMELMAEVVQALLDHLDIPKATFVGHSMGGYVVMALAELAPKKISKLVLLNSTPAEDSPARKQNRERALQLVPRAKDAFVGMAINNLFSEKARMTYAVEIEKLKQQALQFPLEGILAAIEGMKDRKDRVGVLSSFTGDKHMICGTDDPILSYTTCKKIARQTETTFHEVSGGHMSHLENTVKIVKILLLIENNCF